MQKKWNFPILWETIVSMRFVVADVALEGVDRGREVRQVRALLPRQEVRHPVELKAPPCGVVALLELPPSLEALLRVRLDEAQGVVGAVRAEEVVELTVGRH